MVSPRSLWAAGFDVVALTLDAFHRIFLLLRLEAPVFLIGARLRLLILIAPFDVRALFLAGLALFVVHGFPPSVAGHEHQGWEAVPKAKIHRRVRSNTYSA